MITLLAIPTTILAILASTTVPTNKTVRFTVDLTQPTREISPYIYGVNNGGTRPLLRLGGNRWTAYNWENNASNAGSDWHHQSDGHMSSSDDPGEAVRPAIRSAAKNQQAIILTIPMAGYVAADKSPAGDVNKTSDYLNVRFHKSVAKKEGPFLPDPDRNDRFVYQDEFVNWIEKAGRADPRQVIMYSLDNEPDLWSETHARIRPEKLSYAELIALTTEYAKAIKDVRPDALVFGAVNFGWDGYRSLHGAPDADGRDFHQTFLAAMRQAETDAGRRLVDVIDVHYYSESRSPRSNVRVTENDDSAEVAATRVQAPRSLWDATYVEKSWITRDNIPGQPIRMLARLNEDVAKFYPGTKIGVTEYDFGGHNHISGAVAMADALGIFGRQGVFAACWWGNVERSKFIHAALDLYLNFDGKGGRFGNRSVAASTDDIESTAVHASVDDGRRDRMTLVMINRSNDGVSAKLDLAGATADAAEAFLLAAAEAKIKPLGAVPTADRIVLPPMSVTVMRLSIRPNK